MLNTEQKFFSFFKFQDMQWNEHHNKGLIIFCFLHFFLFWFLCSVLRTIFTNPGSVPSVILNIKKESYNFYYLKIRSGIKN